MNPSENPHLIAVLIDNIDDNQHNYYEGVAMPSKRREEAYGSHLKSRRKFPPEYKIDIVIRGFCKETKVTQLCRSENITCGLYYRWQSIFIEGGRNAFTRKAYQRESKEPTNRKPTTESCNCRVLLYGLSSITGTNRRHARKSPDLKAKIIELANSNHLSTAAIADMLGIPRSTYYRWLRKFGNGGKAGLRQKQTPRVVKSKDEVIRNAVFEILHFPPACYNINRTSWRMEDVKRVLLNEKRISISYHCIREIIRSAGYRWKKAKTVLTSNDPEYREKLNHIKSILSSLGKNDRFCSVDEFGPFAVKMKGGKRLVAPNEHPHVPQFQMSKGCLIITAALELSKNQVTHFYSRKKNTTEMIKLLRILLRKYEKCHRLYLSWDAASWHASNAFYEKVEEVNKRTYRKNHCTPIVKLVPLPASAQFLNVIESIFSGMARAIIHNSNYRSVGEAKAAVDRYFKERNQHFRKYPKKAGNKIWRKELVPSRFSEGQNCKDPRW